MWYLSYSCSALRRHGDVQLCHGVNRRHIPITTDFEQIHGINDMVFCRPFAKDPTGLAKDATPDSTQRLLDHFSALAPSATDNNAVIKPFSERSCIQNVTNRQ